jgi:hypothetical protein
MEFSGGRLCRLCIFKLILYRLSTNDYRARKFALLFEKQPNNLANGRDEQAHAFLAFRRAVPPSDGSLLEPAPGVA